MTPTQHCGGGGGDGGGGGAPVRQPQSMQSEPHAHTEYCAPSPPSSQTELFTRAFDVSFRTPSHVFEQATIGGCGGGGDGAGGGGGDGPSP